MRYLLTTGLLFVLFHPKAQSVADIEAELNVLNQKIAGTLCAAGKGPLVSARAMNALLSDKIGSHLSQFTDLSLYKNNITFDAASGTFSLTHNLSPPLKRDTAVRSFFTLGGRANVANAFAAAFTSRPFQNEMGITAKRIWMSEPVMHFNCAQKAEMDAERAALLHSLLAGLQKQADDFEKALKEIKPTDVPGQDVEKSKEGLRKTFLKSLREEANQRFAFAQSQILIKRNAYKKVAVSWTILSVYLPVVRRQFFVAPSLAGSIERKHAYPVELSLHHTRLWEWGKKGRLFLTVAGTVFQNNAVQSETLAPTSVADYVRLGGMDTVRLAAFGRNDIYRGVYENFFTPLIRAQAVYFPPGSHIGLSAQAEQNFGPYRALNLTIGLPVVLIDKDTNPAANFHFQLRYFDVAGSVQPSKPWRDKIFVGMSLGVPFSKIVY